MFTPLHLNDRFSYFSDDIVPSPSCPVETTDLHISWLGCMLTSWQQLDLACHSCAGGVSSMQSLHATINQPLQENYQIMKVGILQM